MKNFIKIFIFFMLPLALLAQENKSDDKKKGLKDFGKTAIDAWEQGEKTGNYTEFKELLSTDFDTFSHPMLGKFTGTAARQKFMSLIAEREKTPNQLNFSNKIVASGEGHAIVSFDSKGTVMGGKYQYEGYNVIAFKMKDGKVQGFREYFGYIDPAFNKK